MCFSFDAFAAKTRNHRLCLCMHIAFGALNHFLVLQYLPFIHGLAVACMCASCCVHCMYVRAWYYMDAALFQCTEYRENLFAEEKLLFNVFLVVCRPFFCSLQVYFVHSVDIIYFAVSWLPMFLVVFSSLHFYLENSSEENQYVILQCADANVFGVYICVSSIRSNVSRRMKRFRRYKFMLTTSIMHIRCGFWTICCVPSLPLRFSDVSRHRMPIVVCHHYLGYVYVSF